MRTFLCVVSPNFPENYEIGVQACTWGVKENYKDKIERTSAGDEIVFISRRHIRSIHTIESKVYRDDKPLWPPDNDDFFPWRIKISRPTYLGAISSDDFVPTIGFMNAVEHWPGTIQGPNGVFNDRLTNKDVEFIKGRLKRIAEPEVEAARAAEQPHIQNLFRIVGADVLESLKRFLPALGLTRYNGTDFPAEYDLGYGGNVILCRDKNDDLVVVDFNRGEAPTETLIRVLHYMSWARQTLAKGKQDVKGIILAESANEALSHVVKEVRNVSLRLYRIGIELLNDNGAVA